MESSVKGKLTFRIAAILFIISAVFELLSITSAVPLFGAIRSGPAAMIYHLLYAALYFSLGIGLWCAKRWGGQLVYAATIFYTLDKVQYIIYRKAMLAELKHQLGVYQDLLQMIDEQTALNLLTIVVLLFAACWWGFAIYTYYRRDYFRDLEKDPKESDGSRN